MNTLIFAVLLFVFSGMYFIVGALAAKKTKTESDYFLAGRNLGLIPVTFTLIATQLGGGMLLGTSQQAYHIGIFGIYYTLGISLGFLLLGLGFAARLQSLNVATTAQLFETKYESARLKKVASLLSIMTLFGIVVSQIVASRTVLLSLGLSSESIFLAFWLLVIAHTMVGGLASVVATDAYQVLYMIITFGAIFLYAVFANPGSLAHLVPSPEQFSSFVRADAGFATMVSFLLMPALFSLIEQDLAQRFFSCATKRIAAGSAFLASLFMILFALVPIYFGVLAKNSGLVLAANENPLLRIIGFLTNDVVVALALCGIIAAISSTVDSLLCAITSNVAQDFNLSSIGLPRSVRSSRVITLLIGLTAVGGSYIFSSNIIGILAGSYELSVSCLFVPLVISYFKNNLNKNGAYGAILGGLFGFIFFKIYPVGIPRELISLALSCLGYFIGSLIKK